MKKRVPVRMVSALLAAVMLFSAVSCALTGKKKEEDLRANPLEIISSVSASGITGNLIPADSSFSIITNRNVSEDTLADMIALEPETGFTLEKVSDKNYKLIPDEPLEESSLVRVKAVSGKKTAYEWAFQTDGELRVIEAYPKGTARRNSGIQIKFSFMDLENFEECFSVKPEIEGKIVQNGKCMVFIPDDDLPEGKYTVTVSGDLKTSEGKTLGKDFSYTFFVLEDYDGFLEVTCSGRNENDSFRCNEVPKAVVSSRRDVNIDVDLRRLDADAFATCIERTAENGSNVQLFGIDFDKLEKVDSFTLTPDRKIEAVRVYSSCTYYEYPSVYPAGFYVASFSTPEGITDYHLFQVSDYSVYALSVEGSVTVWVNDSSSGKAAAGCDVSLGSDSQKTDKNGVAVFESEERKNGVLRITSGQGSFITALSSVEEYEQHDYYTDLYLQSTLYNPGDTVKVWGCIVPRYGKRMPDKVLLNYEDDNYAEVEPDSNGCFTFSFVSRSSNRSYDEIRLIAEKDRRHLDCGRSYYRIASYELPKAKFSVETDKNAYFAGEDAEITVTAAAFDATPIVNTDLSVNVFGDDYSVTTDNNGKAVLRAENIGKNREYYDFLGYDLIRVRLAEDEDNYSNNENTYRVISALDYYAVAELDKDDNLTVKTYKVDLSEINGMPDLDSLNLYKDDVIYRGEPVDAPFRIEAEESYEIKKETGKHYNYFTNETETEYEYEYVSDTVLSTEKSTSGGSFSLSLEPFRKNDGRINARLFFSQGDISVDTWADRNFEYIDNHFFFGHKVEVDNNKGYNPGETVRAQIKDPDGNTPEVFSALFITAAPDKRESFVTSSPEVSFEFSDDYKDCARVFAAFFDGEKIIGVLSAPVLSNYSFDLDVSVKADRQSYAPGDEVSLDIAVTDKQGKPVLCGGVTNVVDEALFTVAHDSPEVYMIKWEDFYTQEYVSTWTCVYDGGDGSGGGDGPESYRTDFEDTPFFETVATGRDGGANVKFTLPDSVTSWHITVKALDSEGRSGYAEISVPATLDYYLSTTGTDIFCEKDDVCVAVKALGKSPETLGESTFTASVICPDGKERGDGLTAKAVPGAYAQFNFGKLEAGPYKVRITAKCGEYKDAVEQEITVVNSKVTTAVVSERELTSGQGIELDTLYRADIRLVDAKYTEYNRIINKLYSLIGSRSDMKVARDFARDWLAGREYVPESCSGSWYNDSETEEKDIELIAKHYAAFSDSIDEFKPTADVFSDNEISAFTKEEQIIYCALLALDNEPVILTLDALNKEYASLPDTQKVWLGIAYAFAGRYDKAKEILSEAYGWLKTEKGLLYYPDDNAYTSEYLTSLIALLAFKTNSPEGEKLVKSLANGDYRHYLPVYEIITYVRLYIGSTVTADSVDIKLGSKTVKAGFLSSEGYHISLTPEELKNAVFELNGCNVNAICRYYSSVDTASRESKDGAPVEVDMPEQIKKGETFNMKFTVSAEDKHNLLTLDFVLPAGIISPGNYSVEEEEARKYSGQDDLPDGRTFHLNLYGSDVYTITVPCKAVFSGDFVLESFAVTEGRVLHIAEERNITVK